MKHDPATLISEKYRDLNVRLHTGGSYGRWGSKWADMVTQIARDHEVRSILDYGCGQGTLKTTLDEAGLDMEVREYDPAIAGKEGEPRAADMVVCTDVLEHIEPELLDNVIGHLRALTGKVLFAVASTRLAVKVLEDGRNAHLIVEPPAFWRQALGAHFRIEDWREEKQEIIATLV